MGISFGSASKKPYVGNKEVQEAYVGSTLVYSAGPGSNYAFLGTADGYYLARWCTYENAVIEQISGIYKMKISGALSNGSLITLDISALSGYTKLMLTAKADGSRSLSVTIDGDRQSKTITVAEQTVTINIPSGAQTITMACSTIKGNIWLNDIYLSN